jgi:hypothetical protein
MSIEYQLLRQLVVYVIISCSVLTELSSGFESGMLDNNAGGSSPSLIIFTAVIAESLYFVPQSVMLMVDF